MTKFIYLLIAVTVSTADAASAYSDANDVAALDSLIAQTVEKKRLPGLSVGIMHEGKTILAKGYGVVSLDTREPVTAETMFSIGSITKQFTCVLALQLAEQAKLSMNDRVSKYFPEASRGGEVSLMDLGQHVSGYRDYYPLDFPDRAMKEPRAGAKIIRDHVKGLDFDPGTQWSYSNTGFLMLGEIVERVEGAPFERVLERRVLGPLGMQRTSYQLGGGHPGAATGYGSFALGDLSSVVSEGKGWLGAAGGMWSTPSDLLSWDLALMDGRLLSTSSQQMLTTPRRLANGRSTSYGCGLGIGEREGMLVWGHLGLTAGFSARNAMLPASKSAVVLMTNVENSAPAINELYSAIIRMFLPAPRQPPMISGLPALAVAASLMGQMQAGTPDRSRLGNEFNAFLTSQRVQAAATALGRLGKQKSVDVTDIENRGEMEHATILFKFDSGNVEAEMYRTPDGIIQQFLVFRK